MARRIEARPRVEAGIARVHRHGVEDPLALAGFSVVRLQEAGHVEVVARAHDDMVVDDDRRHRREILFVEPRNLDAPLLLAGSGVELDEVVVVELGEEEVLPHPDAAMTGVSAATRLPVVLPEDRPVARVHRPDVVGRRGVEHAVHHQNRSADGRGPAGVELARSESADDDRVGGSAAPASSATTARSRRRRGSSGWAHAVRESPRDPRERELLDGRLVDVLQRAVATARQITGVGRPRVGRWTQLRRGIDTAALRQQQRRGHHTDRKQELDAVHGITSGSRDTR